jgi:hypothetical protein
MHLSRLGCSRDRRTTGAEKGEMAAAVFAAPRRARNIDQRQRQGVNDPGMPPRRPPGRGLGVVHAPLSLSVSLHLSTQDGAANRRAMCAQMCRAL